jgi:hypothetical protein|eukprot:CAMPEP_0169113856 /NCGR_PEP_ID=MMETSP1015-20121227/28433_1 /TAXON_ID=342587 /ORGANISM="Karlodinium micrum, Strain CCMP2283" /LENGTH=260 /DNA_ID=CAMNT_0009176071 /DNA_START=55 /DNA_END=837 /DNA_ORIENTATION=+
MGNSCAQDCASLNYNRSNEATFDMNGEHTCPDYQKVSVLQSQTSPSNLPRLGLGTQSQEFLFKNRVPSSTMQEPDFPKLTSGTEEPTLSPIDLPLVGTASKESIQKTSGPDVAISEESSQPGRVTDDSGDYDLASASLEIGKEMVQDSPIVEQVVETLAQELDVAVAALPIRPSLELVFEVNGEDRFVHLHRRPLGAEFTKRFRGRTKIDKIRPHSYASELGMEVGWSIKSIGGEDVSKKSFAEAQACLKNGMMALPVHD